MPPRRDIPDSKLLHEARRAVVLELVDEVKHQHFFTGKDWADAANCSWTTISQAKFGRDGVLFARIIQAYPGDKSRIPARIEEKRRELQVNGLPVRRRGDRAGYPSILAPFCVETLILRWLSSWDADLGRDGVGGYLSLLIAPPAAVRANYWGQQGRYPETDHPLFRTPLTFTWLDDALAAQEAKAKFGKPPLSVLQGWAMEVRPFSFGLLRRREGGQPSSGLDASEFSRMAKAQGKDAAVSHLAANIESARRIVVGSDSARERTERLIDELEGASGRRAFAQDKISRMGSPFECMRLVTEKIVDADVIVAVGHNQLWSLDREFCPVDVLVTDQDSDSAIPESIRRRRLRVLICREDGGAGEPERARTCEWFRDSSMNLKEHWADFWGDISAFLAAEMHRHGGGGRSYPVHRLREIVDRGLRLRCSPQVMSWVDLREDIAEHLSSTDAEGEGEATT